MSEIVRLFRYARHYRGKLALAVVLAVVVAVLASVQLGPMVGLFDVLFGERGPQETLDWAIERFSALEHVRAPLEAFTDKYLAVENPQRTLAWVVGILIGLNLMKGLAHFFQAYTVGKIQTGISRRIAAELYDHMLAQSMSFYGRKGTSSIMARFTNDIEAVGRGLKTLFGKALIGPIKIAIFFTLAFMINWKLLLLNVAIFPTLGVAIYLLGKKARKATRRGLHSRDRLLNILQETFEGISIVKAFNMQGREKKRFGDENERVRNQDLKLARADAAVSPLVEFLGFLGVGASLVAAGYFIAGKGMRTQDVVAFYFALLSMADPIRKLSRFNNRLQALRAASRRVFDFLDEIPDIAERPKARELAGFEDKLRFERVFFTYNEYDVVLRGVDIVAARGETVALVGPSGAGKSTVARLIPRFWDPTSGRVTIDGVDLRDVTLESLRSQIGLVTQEVILFDNTVRANISYGRPDASFEDVEAAARAANADGFISEMPNGYDTVVGEKGLMLSGGQRQRIALARAILKDPPILILDEATSSLDSESEHLIQRALDKFMENRTSIVIAHRLSTVERATRIYVIDNGEIIAAGSNRELLESCPLYKKLYQMQFRNAED